MKSVLRVAVLLSYCAAASQAATIYTAVLSGASEVPATGSPATGSATLTLTGDLLAVNVIFSGLTGGVAAAAHIHCCIAPGGNVGVAVPFTGFPAATSGTYSNTFDLTQTATYTSSYLTTFGGGTAAGGEAALLAALNAGQTYVNIHDAQFPGGEIRGFDNLATPEPGSIVLLSLGLAGLMIIRRRATHAPRGVQA